MDERRTTWNRETFSNDSNHSKEDENFQTINMNYKIERIKKDKKRRKVENFKNIEPLENIHEPLTNFELCKDYDGVEKECEKDESGEKGGANESFAPSVKDFFGVFDTFNYNKAKMLAQVLSNNTQTESDVLILKKYIALFEIVLLSYFFAYNLFFIMFYRDEYGLFIHDRMWKLDGTYVKNESQTNPLFIPIDWVFGYAIKFGELLQKILFNFIPKMSSFFNPSSCFIFLFLSLIYILENSVSSIKQFFLSIAEGDLGNPWVVLFFGILIFNIATSAFDIFNINTATYSMSWIRNFVLFLPWSILMVIVQFIVIMIVSVPIGVILCAIMFVYFCVFLIPYALYYGDFTRLSLIFKKITFFIEKNNASNIHADPETGELSFYNKVKFVLNAISDFLYVYILYIVYLFVIVFALIDYLYNIKSSNLKMSLGALSSSLIIFFVSLCIVGFIRTTDMDRTLPDDTLNKIEGAVYQGVNMLPDFVKGQLPAALTDPEPPNVE